EVVAVQSAPAPGSGAFGSFDNVDFVDIIRRVLVKLPYGNMVPTPTALTPGSSRARAIMLKISRRASAGSFFTKVKSISVTRSPAATNPGFNPAAFIAPRKNNPAAKSNTNE